MSEIVPIKIDLSAATVDESWLRAFGSSIQSILNAMFGGNKIPVTVKGSRSEVDAFAKTLAREKRYMDAYKKFGLDNPITYKTKFKLNRAVKDFERTTGLVWPLR